MIRILIVEDEIKIAKDIESYLSFYLNRKEMPFVTKICIQSKDILNNLTLDWDMIVMDVEMPEINGIELAEKIREKNKKVIIAFITNYHKYVMDAYKVHAFDYIAKPISQEKIDAFMDDLITYGYFKNKEREKYMFTTTNGYIQINGSEILYFEYIDKSKEYGTRIVKMQTKDRVYIIRDKISSIFLKLNHKRFAVPHKSFIINFENVKRFKGKEIIMVNDDLIPLSQKKSKEIKLLFNHYISEELKL